MAAKNDVAFWVAASALAGSVLLAIVSVSARSEPLDKSFFDDLNHPSIQYASAPLTNRVARVNQQIEAGSVQLTSVEPQGYLRSVLSALDVPIESQMVVFSKTSVQAPRISPRNPRTLFFNDSVVVGWVRGGFVEIAAQDPQQGVIFYTVERDSQGRARFSRRDFCLSCHHSYATLGIPGLLLRSQFTAPDGNSLRQLGSYVSDHRSPFAQRWGGWYVTGKSGAIRHMGNAFVTDPANPDSMVTDETLHVESLKGRFDTDAYLSPYSDIVALMVFEHQVRMMNLLTRAGWEVRLALYQQQTTSGVLPTAPDSRDVQVLLGDLAGELVDYLLFVDEAPLGDKIEGTSGFAERFAAQGPFDREGRSLRQLDLERRIMRYPCSYMIYADAFLALPSELREAIYARMWRILSGDERTGAYARLSRADRQAILEILRDTKKDLPSYFTTTAR